MCKLLIVDDNISDRKGLSELVDWKAMGITEIFLAKNGLEGYKAALEHKPSLVLTDISMPIMDGLEMAENILKELSDTKFIFMSCYDDVDYIKEAVEYNSYAYLLKPIDLDKLIKATKKILQIKMNENEISNSIISLKNKIEEDIPYIQEMVTRDIVFGNLNNSYFLQLESIGLDVKELYSVFIIQIKDTEEDINRNCEFIQEVRMCLHDNILDNMRVSSFLQSRDKLVVLTFFDDTTDEQEGIERLFYYLKEVKDCINCRYGHKAILCTAGVCSDISQAREMYNNIEYTLMTNIYEMGNNIILAESNADFPSVLDFDIFKLHQEIKEMMANNDIDEQEKLLDMYYGEKIYNRDSLKALTYTLISILQINLLERGESFESIFGDNVSIWNKLSSYNTIVDIRQWIINIFKFVYDYLNDKNKNIDKYLLLVTQIKEIIDEEYGQIENVSQVTEKVSISVSYANHIFKKYEGSTIFEYLVQIRMEKAKDMLENTNMRVYEISEKVGYISKTYFTSLFREYTGKTPQNYRNQKRGTL